MGRRIIKQFYNFTQTALNLENVYWPAEHFHFVIVDLLVGQVMPVIFQGIFDGDDKKNHEDRDHCYFLLKSFDSRDPVQ